MSVYEKERRDLRPLSRVLDDEGKPPPRNLEPQPRDWWARMRKVLEREKAGLPAPFDATAGRRLTLGECAEGAMGGGPDSNRAWMRGAFQDLLNHEPDIAERAYEALENIGAMSLAELRGHLGLPPTGKLPW